MANENKKRIVNAIWENPAPAFGCDFKQSGQYWENKRGGEYGITANSVSPGVIETEMSKSLGLSIDTYPDIYLKRLGAPEDVANAILYLVSPLGSYLTGQNISVNGGQTMR